MRFLPLLLATAWALFWPSGSPVGETAFRGVAAASVPVAPEPEEEAETTEPNGFPAIAAWQRPLRRCGRRGRRRFCDGPRQVPEPHGDAAERARRLGLEGKDGWNRVMGGAAPADVLAEVPGDPSDDLLWPVPDGFMGRGFGHNRRRQLRHRLHRGVDIPAPVGSLVRAAQGGLVIHADNSVSGYGNLVVVLHPGDRRTVYAHLKRSAVFAGQVVERGQVLGEVGRTGLTYAPHLHFEYRVRARARNPRRRFVERPSFDEEKAMMADAARRRREGRARLAELREARERRRRRGG
ncbi:MAG: hypothetical protein CMN30_21015 [Sandaracinus sp.]|nr:hypothetical protein [Sandaracinus sp.]